ncbi:hypothetical protein V6C45_16590 [Paenibacillus barengoltzii]
MKARIIGGRLGGIAEKQALFFRGALPFVGAENLLYDIMVNWVLKRFDANRDPQHR